MVASPPRASAPISLTRKAQAQAQAQGAQRTPCCPLLAPAPPCPLSPGPWQAAHSTTMKGWLTSCKISFSFLMCSTCFSLTTSDFFMIFSAKKQLAEWMIGPSGGGVFSSATRRSGASQRRTRPKVPVPD